jgi:hypothetical protein
MLKLSLARWGIRRTTFLYRQLDAWFEAAEGMQ